MIEILRIKIKDTFETGRDRILTQWFIFISSMFYDLGLFSNGVTSVRRPGNGQILDSFNVLNL